MAGPERYHLVAPLPPLGGWRRMLALDRRRGSQSGPVVLSFAPLPLVEDAARLAALSRDAEAGARVHHANVLPVLGLEAVDDQLVLVEPYRAGTALRALLDASGRLPAQLAVRVACDAAAGLAALHGLTVGDGQRLAHGAVSADRILVAEDGTSLVTGVGTGAGRSVAADVPALAAVLAEMLTGEPPRAGVPLEAPGIPVELAAVIERARGEGGFPDAAAFAEALAGAFAPAPAAAVSVSVGSAAPPPAAVPPAPPAAAEAPEVSAELIAPGRLGAAGGSPAELPAERVPPPDAAITFPAPVPAAARLRLPRAPILLVLVVVGFALGVGISRAVLGPPAAPVPASAPAPAPATSQGAPDADPATSSAPAPAEAHSAPPAPPAPPSRQGKVAPPARAREAKAAAAPAAAEPPRKPSSISVTATPPGEILVDGKVIGRAPLVVEVAAGEHEVRLRDRALRVDVRQRVRVKGPVTPVRFQLARGRLDVTAPADTEIWVDGRRVGMGDQKVDLWEGWHEVEARRNDARVKERFELTAIITNFTYNVTPTD